MSWLVDGADGADGLIKEVSINCAKWHARNQPSKNQTSDIPPIFERK